MKRFIKIALVALLLCTTFVFGGCGGGQLSTKAKIDIGDKESYKAVSIDDENAYIKNPTTVNTNFKGYRLSLNSKINAEMEGQKIDLEIDLNMLYAIDGVGNTQVAMHSTMKGDGQEISESSYYKDGWAYQSMKNFGYDIGKFKMQTSIEDLTNNLNLDLNISLFGMGLREILSMISLSPTLDNVTITGYKEDNIYRFHLKPTESKIESGTEESESEETFINEVYLVFKNQNLTNARIVLETGFINYKITIEKTDELVDYPSFSGYEEFPDMGGIEI